MRTRIGGRRDSLAWRDMYMGRGKCGVARVDRSSSSMAHGRTRVSEGRAAPPGRAAGLGAGGWKAMVPAEVGRQGGPWVRWGVVQHALAAAAAAGSRRPRPRPRATRRAVAAARRRSGRGVVGVAGEEDGGDSFSMDRPVLCLGVGAAAAAAAAARRDVRVECASTTHALNGWNQHNACRSVVGVLGGSRCQSVRCGRGVASVRSNDPNTGQTHKHPCITLMSKAIHAIASSIDRLPSPCFLPRPSAPT